MERLLIKILFYGALILFILEGLVRVFHLHKGTPERMIDDRGVEKWVPGQSGYIATGNRRQNFAEYRINNFGYNSYREFAPTEDGYEIALIGDSFIEGFHQDYDNSIGKKIEDSLPGVEVYEFGYAGYDLADELHLISAYPELFDKIDQIVIFLQYPDDLLRGSFKISKERLKLQEGTYALLKKSKLLVYLQNIRFLGNMTGKLNSWKSNLFRQGGGEEKRDQNKEQRLGDLTLHNFKSLLTDPGLKTKKISFLVDRKSFPDQFMSYLEKEGISTIDYGEALEFQQTPVTLIYDMHWNDQGRKVIAEELISFIRVHYGILAENGDILKMK
ncbi:hypothetical protein E7Z59_13380 [Robertkochia marina]|uniref:SGNH/GDSL hydrolase family protein n=1 Tax=Robertkochia marina TaxID=1227945 RepID=A0A4S3LZM7_9FLAO|nr:hypothetical protein [Robertkochia marina]THD66765.1 hypothetical protein E7Z59_13380 [Robertkochia marina]TRZ42346.1 hypothetical protein D3A96_11820 [Robertkochia marina]